MEYARQCVFWCASTTRPTCPGKSEVRASIGSRVGSLTWSFLFNAGARLGVGKPSRCTRGGNELPV
eukprot:9468778-Pyramimonas_sp.AAC.1